MWILQRVGLSSSGDRFHDVIKMAAGGNPDPVSISSACFVQNKSEIHPLAVNFCNILIRNYKTNFSVLIGVYISIVDAIIRHMNGMICRSKKVSLLFINYFLLRDLNQAKSSLTS